MKHDIFGWFVLVFLGSVVLVQATTRGTTTRTKTAATCTTSRYSRQEQYGLSGWVYSSIVRHRGGSSTLPTTETQNSNPNSNTQLDHQPLVVNTTSTNNIDDHHHDDDIHKNGTTTIDTHDNSQLLLLLPKWKQTLPLSLQSRKTLHRILIPNGIQARTSITKNSNSIRQEEPQQSYIELYILGTSHVSNDSSTDVKTLLQHIKPNVVFLELCSQRIGMLESTSSSSKSSQNDEEKATATNDHQKEEEQKMSLWQRAAHLQSNSEGMLTRGSAMGTTLLTKVQDGYAESLGVELGSEFRVAYQWCYNTTVQAQQQQQQHPPAKPLHLILGDRPLQLTLLRAWESLRFWGKLKVLGGLLINCLWQEKPEEIRAWMNKILEGDSDVLTESIAEMAKHFPTLERVIIQERDAYMAAKLYQTCRLLPTGHNVTLVAIVGAGHCPGICQWLTNGNGKSPEEILSQIISTKKHPISELQSVIHDVTELPIVVP